MTIKEKILNEVGLLKLPFISKEVASKLALFAEKYHQYKLKEMQKGKNGVIILDKNTRCESLYEKIFKVVSEIDDVKHAELMLDILERYDNEEYYDYEKLEEIGL